MSKNLESKLHYNNAIFCGFCQKLVDYQKIKI